jgi:plastocyanin
MKKQEDNQIPRVRSLTTLAMIFLSIADLLIVASVLPSTLTITTIASKVAFAQQQSAHEENQPDGKQVVVSSATTNRKPTEILSKVRILLNQSINEYRKQNFTGAQELTTSAYLDNFEFIEAQLGKRDNALANNTEIMLRELLKQFIKDRLPLENIQQLINKIKDNLDKTEKLLPDTESSIQTTGSATQSNMTNSTTNTVLPRTLQSSSSSSPTVLNTTNKILIAGDESDKPYMPSSITIKTGDKVGWINTDEEVHTVTSGFENSTDKGKKFDSGLLNTNQTFEHTFDKAGTYNYFCTVHPTMTGVVNIK